MKPPILDVNGERLIGAKPRERTVERPIVAVRMQDEDGSVEAIVQPDITALEAYHIANLLMWCVTQPGPQRHPQTGDIVHIKTMWRKYIADNQLERHFKFSDGVPVREAGHA